MNPYNQTITMPIGIIVTIAYLKDLITNKRSMNTPTTAIGNEVCKVFVIAVSWISRAKGDPVRPTYVFLRHFLTVQYLN
ncbi:MAG: hypothetical protein CM1200mP37_6070 [Chloroflexota bacterium]|nr:MAG: hypothetical protein CM1200mP37_6070 [Chloroflexota bacterium]